MVKLAPLLLVLSAIIARASAEPSIDFEAVREALRTFVTENREELKQRVPSLVSRDCCGKSGDKVRPAGDGFYLVGHWLVSGKENLIDAGYFYRTFGDGDRGPWAHEESVSVLFERRERILKIKEWRILRPEKKEAKQ